MTRRSKSAINNSSATVPNMKKEYFCDTMEHPFGIPRHIMNTFWLSSMHIFGLHGWIMLLSGELPSGAWLTGLFYSYCIIGLGTTVGAHRLWCHRSFKARLPLRIFLAFAQTASGQFTIFKWCRDHRLHHKYSESDADPHDARKGFWYAHLGWLLLPEAPLLKEKEETLDLTDLDQDPIVRFQHQHYYALFPICVFLVPISMNHYFFPELTLYQLMSHNFAWFMATVHFTSLVNSAAHLWGNRPYDKNIFARENPLVALLASGEGWHNFHHCFPSDYKAAEELLLPILGSLNWSTAFIDLMAWVGLAYDLKTTPKKLVEYRLLKTKSKKDGSSTKARILKFA